MEAIKASWVCCMHAHLLILLALRILAHPGLIQGLSTFILVSAAFAVSTHPQFGIMLQLVPIAHRVCRISSAAENHIN